VHFRSLTTRLISWTLLASGAVFLTTLVASNRVARETAVRAAEEEARQTAQRLANRVRGVLSAVEESAQFLAVTLETLELKPGATERLLRRYVVSEQDIYGAAAAYAPGEAHGRELFAPYVYGRSDDPAALRAVDLAAPGYDYVRRAWYAVPARSGEPTWSEPYLDVGASGEAIVTYAVPFFAGSAKARRLRGLATADLRLDWLQAIVRDVRLGKTGRTLVLSREGRILAFSGPRALASVTPLVEQLPADVRLTIEPLVHRMLSGQSGFQPLELDGGRGRMLYLPVGAAGWSLGVFYPEEELMAGATRLRAIQLPLALLGLLVLGAVVVFLARRLTAPLRELSAAARGLAVDLDADLPTPHSADELGALAIAFRDMRDALRRYIHELETTTAAKQRLEGELAVARRIQMDMLPSPSSGGVDDGYEIAALLEPARTVGGDLYDHRAVDGRVFFLVADVSGKGVGAALFMARAKALFEAWAARPRSPTETLVEVNRGLTRENDAGLYVTAVCGWLETATGGVTWACAGHEPPLHVPREGRPEPLAGEGGPVLGLLDAVSFPSNVARLAPGDALLAYTDGVGEAFDKDGELFGTGRLVASVAAAPSREPQALNATVREAVRRFAATAPQSDDITILTLRYCGAPAGAAAARPTVAPGSPTRD
jgi:sigma-B regulation protein RsbU (phosphoserine phosphatase)